MEKRQPLFSEFVPTSKEQWIEQMIHDLKGKHPDELLYTPEDGVSCPAYFYPEPSNSHPKFISKPNGNLWRVCEEFEAVTQQNKAILNALNSGTNSLFLRVNDQSSFDQACKDVLFEYIHTIAYFSKSNDAIAFNFPSGVVCAYDPLYENLKCGSWREETKDYVSFFSKNNPIAIGSAIKLVNGFIYGNSGASVVQELAFTLAHLNEYLQALWDNGVKGDALFKDIHIRLSSGGEYLLNIARFRAIRHLVSLLAEGYEYEHPVHIQVSGKTRICDVAVNDRYNNLLRQTIHGMSAVIGGCDELVIDPFEANDPMIVRVTRGIQLILKEEAYLDKVADPCSGAYSIEYLTDQLVKSAWNQFLEIEEKGGFTQAVKENRIQDEIKKNRSKTIEKLNSGKQVLTGVNKYKHPTESFQEGINDKTTIKVDFEPLNDFSFESNYTEKVESK